MFEMQNNCLSSCSFWSQLCDGAFWIGLFTQQNRGSTLYTNIDEQFLLETAKFTGWMKLSSFHLRKERKLKKRKLKKVICLRLHLFFNST